MIILIDQDLISTQVVDRLSSAMAQDFYICHL